MALLSLRSTFAQALDVLADVAQHPAFPTAEVERQRAARLGALTQQRDDPAQVAAVAAASALYGAKHPYGYGRAESLAAMLVALLMFAAGVGICVEAVHEIRTPHHAPAWWTLLAPAREVGDG